MKISNLDIPQTELRKAGNIYSLLSRVRMGNIEPADAIDVLIDYYKINIEDATKIILTEFSKDV